MDEILAGLAQGKVLPYLGPGVLALIPNVPVPATPEALAVLMTAKVSVPFKIRRRLTQATQFIENFKHRKSVVNLMNEAFAAVPEPSALHRAIAAAGAPLVVDTWYDDTLMAAFQQHCPAAEWGQVQGRSQAELNGHWTQAYDAAGQALETADPAWRTLLYRPLGGHRPAANYLVSDSDFVEVLTEIDIQTPIPAEVVKRRTGRHFLFLGCRFDDQLTRTFARQIMKRSSGRHWAVLPNEPTRMERRFLEEQGIERIACSLEDAAEALFATAAATPA